MSLLAGANVAGDDHRDAAGQEERCRNRVTRFDQQAGDAGQRAEQRERANPAETRVGAGGVSRSLALDADSRAAEDGNGETGETAEVEVHAVSIPSCLCRMPARCGHLECR